LIKKNNKTPNNVNMHFARYFFSYLRFRIVHCIVYAWSNSH